MKAKHDHAQQQPAVPEARDVGFAVFARGVADRHFGGLQVELGGAEDQVEIAERIELAEIGAVARDLVVVASAAAPWCRTACRCSAG